MPALTRSAGEASPSRNIHHSGNCFQKCSYAEQLQEDCALPFGFALQPFAPVSHAPLHKTPAEKLADIPRCSSCGAYLNCFNAVDMIGFRCSICSNYTEWTSKQSKRYGRTQARDQRRELVQHVYEVLCPDIDDQATQQGMLLCFVRSVLAAR